ncbi:hypothetical protein KY305_01710 [Bacillus sp. YC2]|uniref:hypothetical protein n=1 Tax=Bacillus sp. YC2 TaxID=2861287 RepID=UPI001CA73293|nr:hypothetical protein [Bacillus sp. YC2]MBY8911474.1 hypothetical protein [Bacillus sp. YC2]
MKKSGYIGGTAVVIGAIIFILSIIYLRQTDYYAVRWIGAVLMFGGIIFVPTYKAKETENSNKKETR